MLELGLIIGGIVYFIALSIYDSYTFFLPKPAIPSALTSGAMLLAFTLNFPFSIVGLAFGGVVALFFYDMNIFDGKADMKLIVFGAMLLQSYLSIMLFLAIIPLIKIILVVNMKLLRERHGWGNVNYIPFIPAIFFSFAIVSVLTLVGLI